MGGNGDDERGRRSLRRDWLHAYRYRGHLRDFHDIGGKMVDLNIFKRHREELVGLMLDHVSEMGAHRTEEEMIERRYAEIEELMEKLRHQKRALDHMTGKEVPPELQFGKAVVTGFGGGV